MVASVRTVASAIKNARKSDSIFVVFGSDGCIWCQRSKELLSSKSIPFTFVPITSAISKSLFQYIVSRHPSKHEDASTIPQIFIANGTYIGGFSDLLRLIDALRLYR